MKQLGIDCRELNNENLSSLGLFLKMLVETISDVELIAFSPLPLSGQFSSFFSKQYVWGRAMTGGSAWLSYQLWIKAILDKERIETFYEVNHFLLVKPSYTKTVVTIHDLYPISGIEKIPLKTRLIFKYSLKSTLKNADVIFVRSQITEQEIRKRFHTGRRLFVNAHALSLMEKVGRREPVIDGRYILMLGRVCHWKGQKRLVQLFEQYLQGSGLRLVLAGGLQPGDDAEYVKSRAEQNDKIVYMGYIDEETKVNLIENCELFCYTSRFDGFGVPPLEAMRLGARCLMNDLPVLRETTKNLGRYVDYYSRDDAVVEQIESVISDESYPFAELADLANEYTIENSVRNAIAVIDSVGGIER